MSFSHESITLPNFLNFDSNKENLFEGFDFGLAEKIISEGLHQTCAICLNNPFLHACQTVVGIPFALDA